MNTPDLAGGSDSPLGTSGPLSKSSNERIRLALGGVAIVGLVFGFWQLKTSIGLPFAVLLPPENTTAATQADTTADEAVLRAKDTDGDGLSDYDELAVYRTSQYLKDTDSDGTDDKSEIAKGTDPNCASGSTCTPVAALRDSTGTKPAGEESAGSTPVTAESIREFLRKSGVSEAEIAKYDDATLLNMYQEVSAEPTVGAEAAEAGSGEAGTGSLVTLTPEQKLALSKLSISELRDFLIKGGADKATLDQIDDATLKALVQDAIK